MDTGGTMDAVGHIEYKIGYIRRKRVILPFMLIGMGDDVFVFELDLDLKVVFRLIKYAFLRLVCRKPRNSVERDVLYELVLREHTENHR